MSTPSRRLAAILGSLALLLTACSGNGGATTAPTAAAPTPGATTAASAAPATEAPPVAGGLLDKVMKAGKRLGVKVEFATPSWDVITAGSWAGRWDISVGSMTITTAREEVLAFSSAYYFTPAQMTATTKSGITTLEGLAGKTVCAGTATTYVDWMKGQLTSVSLGPVATPPAGIKVKELPTDQECAQAIAAGQNVGEGFLSSSTTVDAAIENGTPIVKVGDPVFTEQLAASADKSGPDPTDFIAKVSKIIDDMHADGTLTAMSMKWFKADLTQKPA